MKCATILTALTLCVNCFTQTHESFTDGNFNSNPVWRGDTSKFIVNSNHQLQLNAASAGQSQLRTSVTFDPAVPHEWRFHLALDFSPSNSNRVELWLIGDSTLENGTMLRIGESGSNDAVRLFEVNHGTTEEILAGAHGIVATVFEIELLIRRSYNGEWRVWINQDGLQDYVGYGVEQAMPFGTDFGIHCQYTSSNSTGFRFDDFYHGNWVLDTIASSCEAFQVLGADKLELNFDEALDTSQFLNQSFVGFVPPLAVDSVVRVNDRVVQVVLSEEMESNQPYQIHLTGFRDTASNETNQLIDSVVYYHIEVAAFGDVIINEVFPDPEPSVGLPVMEFVEILNRSEKILNIEGWTFSDETSEGTLPPRLFFPNELLVLCKSGCQDSFPNAIELSNWPSLNNSGDDLELRNESLSLIDAVAYSNDWFGETEEDGISLERINPNLRCSSAENWGPSTHALGGTPGASNFILDTLHLVESNELLEFHFNSGDTLNLLFKNELDSLGLSSIQLETSGNIELNTVQMSSAFSKDLAVVFDKEVPPSEPFQLSISNINNCNEVPNTNIQATIVRAEVPEVGDLVLNEILFDPYSGGADFVEVYNRTDKYLNLTGLQIQRQDEFGAVLDGDSVRGQLLLSPEDFVVFTESAALVQQFNSTAFLQKCRDIDLPNFPNDSGKVVLSLNQSILDSFTYSSKMHFQLLHSTDGKSLERINSEVPTSQANNWHTAAESVGFSTPGYINSQHATGQPHGQVALLSKVVSPDNDGYQDVLQVTYELDAIGYLVNARIYSKWGVLVKDLSANELVGPEGSLFWDGLKEDGTKASIGEYVLIFEAIHSMNGSTFAQKLPVIVAGKLEQIVRLMISPGSKGWINKYLDLFKKGQLLDLAQSPLNVSDKEYLHLSLLETGIVFGYPAELLFAKELDTKNWTDQEKLKVLLFESLLSVFLQEKGSLGPRAQVFKDSLLIFYKNHSAHFVNDLFKLILKESEEQSLEKVLSRRLEVKGKILESNYWVNYLSNTFVFLDVVLYRQFLRKEKQDLKAYAELAKNALAVIAYTSFSTGTIDDAERKLFQQFLVSARLKDKERKSLEQLFETGATLNDLGNPNEMGWLYRRFLMDVSALTIFANQEVAPDELDAYNDLCEHLSIPQKEVDMAMVMVENFVLEHNDKVDFLKSSKSYEQLLGSLSRRWIKILSRNKDKLALELRESKELVYLVGKSAKEELSDEEKTLVKNQFRDIIKSMPALAIFMLPGGALLLPLVLKVLPDLVPSAFRSNELGDEDQDQEFEENQ